MSSQCSICSNPAARDVIDGALLAGMRPSHIHQRYGEALGVSLSATFRHARGHVRSSLAPTFLGDATKGETIADLSALARSLYQQHIDAREAGQASASARFGGEARQAFSALLAAGVESESAAETWSFAEQQGATLAQLLFENRDLLPVAADVARRHGHDLMVEELETNLPEALAAFDAANPTKENHHDR